MGLTVLILIAALVLVIATKARENRMGCVFPTGRMGDVVHDMYTRADGKSLNARCTNNGWEATGE